MAFEHVKEDWGWLKSEVKLGINFLRKYFKDKSDDSKKDRKVKALEFGPYNGIKLLIVVIISLIILFAFSMYRSEKGIILAVIIFIILFDIFFAKEWTTPFLKELGVVFWHMIQGVFAIIKDIGLGIKESFMGPGNSSSSE